MIAVISDLKALFIKNKMLITIIILFFSISNTSIYYFSLILLPLLLLKNNISKYIDECFLFLCVFSLLYAITTTMHGFNSNSNGNLIFYSIYPPLFYITGRYLTNVNSTRIYALLLLTVFLIGISTIYLVINDIQSNQFINIQRSIEIGNNTKASSATLLGALVSLCVASIGLIFSHTSNNSEKVYKIIFVILGILGCMCVIHLVNRTGLVLAVISCFAVIFKNIKYFKSPKIVISIILILIVLSYLVYPILESTNAINVYQNREQDQEFGISSAGGRTERWMDGLSHIFTSPMGGGRFESGYISEYAHNLWLDVSGMAGVFPFFALIVGTVIVLKRNYYLIIKSNLSPFFSSLILVCNIGFFLTCFVEPILEGSFTYTVCYFFFWGITSELYFKTKNQSVNT